MNSINIRMIVTDLDGTLLRTDKTVSAYTEDVLRRCRAREIHVVFATARPMRTVRQFFGVIPADALILHNGAATFIGDAPFAHSGIAPGAAARILRAILLENPEATLSVEIDDTLYANFDVSTVWANLAAVHTDFTDLPDKPAEKIIAGVSSMADIERYAALLPDDLYIEMCEGKLGLIMHRDATKLNAVRALASHYGCDRKEIAAFGDDYNDIEMIRGSGVGVAMAGALAEVKAAAGFIADTNDRDGVAKWIDANILKGGM